MITNIEMVSAAGSSFTGSVGHDGHALYVEFRTGDTYPHPGVPLLYV